MEKPSNSLDVFEMYVQGTILPQEKDEIS